MNVSIKRTMANNRLIAKNTVFIYIRMIIVLFVTLFSVRIILHVLGNTDYGVYNVVAGFVSMLAIISTTLRLAINRFLAFAIGEGDRKKTIDILNQSLICFFGIAVILLLFFETIGLWFVSNKLVIPPERLSAALWVYQFSIVSFIITIIAVPFGALVVAYEDLSFYSILSIAEAFAKLGIVYAVKILPYDKLVFYGMLLLLVVVIKEAINFIFCLTKYDTCKFRFVWNKDIFKSLFSFAGWTMYGATANVANNQGNNILTNLFFGPNVNADRSVAFQVSNALSMFGTNLFVAFKPPIVKSYAQGDYAQVNHLFMLSSKMSFYLCLMLLIPLYLETPLLLKWWLGNPTENMFEFTRLTLLYSIIVTQGEPITALIQATGRIRLYHLVVESVTLLSLPLTYVAFAFGYNASSSFIISIIVFLIAHGLRIIILSRSVDFFQSKRYIYNVIIKSLVVSVISIAIVYPFHRLLEQGIIRFVVVSFCSLTIVLLSSYIFGLESKERDAIKRIIKSKMKK